MEAATWFCSWKRDWQRRRPRLKKTQQQSKKPFFQKVNVFLKLLHPRVRVHSFRLLCPCVDQHCLSGQSGLHTSLGDHVPAPVVGPLRIHRPQLLVALSDAVPRPQLVAEAFALLCQDVDLFHRAATDGASVVAFGDRAEPG